MNNSEEKIKRNLHLGIVLNQNVKVWRYMDLPKFMSLLENEALYFCRADLFLDPFEGSITKPSVEFREKVWRESMPGISQTSLDNFQKFHKFRLKEERKNFFINCWHMNDHESMAMWDLYGVHGQSIAIQSRYHVLRKCLPENQGASGQPLENHVDIGLVQYLDYSQDSMPQIYSFDPFLRKRKSYAHEQEIRLFYQSPSQPGSYTEENGEIKFTPQDGNFQPFESGKLFKTDLNLLIENIFLSPSSPSWYKELIEKICDRYNFNKEVKQSGMNESPLY
nr:hypothetical protein [uncultured Desulfuromonas sp.]